MITVYSYDVSGVYVGETTAREDPLTPGHYLLPGRSTTVQPPVVNENESPVWNGTAWGVVTDARGTWYDIFTQARTVVFDVGDPVPVDATKVTPPEGETYWQFNGTVWERTLSAAKEEKRSELLEAYDAAISTTITVGAHDYDLTETFITLLEIALEVQGSMVDLYDVDHNVFQLGQVDAQAVRDALYLGRLAEVLNRESKLKQVDDAPDIPTVDAISY